MTSSPEPDSPLLESPSLSCHLHINLTSRLTLEDEALRSFLSRALRDQLKLSARGEDIEILTPEFGHEPLGLHYRRVTVEDTSHQAVGIIEVERKVERILELELSAAELDKLIVDQLCETYPDVGWTSGDIESRLHEGSDRTILIVTHTEQTIEPSAPAAA